jgi:hypothetical protein
MRVTSIVKIVVFFFFLYVCAQDAINTFSVVRIKYDGGGDWYGNKTAFINLFKKMNQELAIRCTYKEATAEILDESFFNYPVAYIAGHGNIKFSEEEVVRLRAYLVSGGFLFADDDYGMDHSFRREMKKVFPELNFVELPFDHPVYHIHYQFNQGLPKIHEHNGGAPKGLGLLYKGRLIVFYSYNTDISDGCEDIEIHNDPPEKHEEALCMGINILLYALVY